MLTKKKLEKLYNSGLSLDKIAERENLSRAGIQYWMEKYKIPKRQRFESGFLGHWGMRKNIPLPKNITRKQIEELYLKKGFSANDLARKFNRSTGAIYRLMERGGITRRSAKETNYLKYQCKKPSFKIKKNLSSKEQKLKIAGIMLYWAEGYKNLGRNVRGGTIDLANSDSKMIETFLKFLREICGIKEDKLRIQLYCYTNQNVGRLNEYWSDLTKISVGQFIKPYVRSDFLPEKIDKMKHGLVHIRYSDKKLFSQIKKWTEEYLNSIGIK